MLNPPRGQLGIVRSEPSTNLMRLIWFASIAELNEEPDWVDSRQLSYQGLTYAHPYFFLAKYADSYFGALSGREYRTIMTGLTNNPIQWFCSTNSLFIALDIPSDLLRAHLWITAGVEPDVLVRLAGTLGSDIKTICNLAGVSQSTFTSKLKRGVNLSHVQGARVYGVIQVLDAVVSLHEGDVAMAISWLYHSAKGLGGEKPASVLTTAMGVQAVLDLVGQITHGIVS